MKLKKMQMNIMKKLAILTVLRGLKKNVVLFV